jgi:hypothetical protein
MSSFLNFQPPADLLHYMGLVLSPSARDIKCRPLIKFLQFHARFTAHVSRVLVPSLRDIKMAYFTKISKFPTRFAVPRGSGTPVLSPSGLNIKMSSLNKIKKFPAIFSLRGSFPKRARDIIMSSFTKISKFPAVSAAHVSLVLFPSLRAVKMSSFI